MQRTIRDITNEIERQTGGERHKRTRMRERERELRRTQRSRE
jgi:hypothetical protein